MTVYPQALNEGLGSIKTAANYDANVGNWLHYSAQFVQNASGVWVPLTLDANGRQQVSVKDSALPAGAATAENQAAIAGYIDGIETLLTALNSKDFATQTTLAAVLAKLISAPSTEAGQAALQALIGEVQAAPTTNTILARLKSVADKIDAITAGTTPAVTQLSGSNILKGALATVTTAGTRIQLPAYACHEVTVIAKRGNTGYVYVGGSDVSSTVYGIDLKARDSFTFQVGNTNMLYMDADVSGEGLSYVAV